MHYNMDWHIEVGAYKLALLDSVEVHNSVDLLANTCEIKLPGAVYNKTMQIEDEDGKDRIKRGDAVLVQFGYDGKLQDEFKGYLLDVSTDDGSITINCENELFLMRVSVPDKEFKKVQVKDIAQFLINETKLPLKLNCTLTIDYDKFVISKATAYDVLKKLKDETKGNFYIKNGVLNIHPPYIETHGTVNYSFQKNIEKSDLKYKKAADKKIQIIVENVGGDGKKKTVMSGTTGGDKITLQGNGLSDSAMKILADNELRRQQYDGYEGSITTWLIPYVEPGYSAVIQDSEYPYKDGRYYVTAVTNSFNVSGGVRKVQLGIKI